MRGQPERVIRASEVSAYVYCAQAWWLSSECQLRPSNAARLEQGSLAHQRHGQRVVVAAALIRLAYLVLGLALLSGAFWLLTR